MVNDNARPASELQKRKTIQDVNTSKEEEKQPLENVLENALEEEHDQPKDNLELSQIKGEQEVQEIPDHNQVENPSPVLNQSVEAQSQAGGTTESVIKPVEDSSIKNEVPFDLMILNEYVVQNVRIF